MQTKRYKISVHSITSIPYLGLLSRYVELADGQLGRLAVRVHPRIQVLQGERGFPTLGTSLRGGWQRRGRRRDGCRRRCCRRRNERAAGRHRDDEAGDGCYFFAPYASAAASSAASRHHIQEGLLSSSAATPHQVPQGHQHPVVGAAASMVEQAKNTKLTILR